MNNHPSAFGIFGTCTSMLGVGVSAIPEIEAWLRLFGAVVAIISGVLTCLYMLKQLRKK
jgi:hypothetical protein